MKWEYTRLLVRPEVYLNPLNEEWILPSLEELGEAGWELTAVDNGIAYFKRPKEGNEAVERIIDIDNERYAKEFLEEMYGNNEEALEEEDKEAASQEDSTEQQVNHQKSHIGELYSRAYE